MVIVGAEATQDKKGRDFVEKSPLETAQGRHENSMIIRKEKRDMNLYRNL